MIRIICVGNDLRPEDSLGPRVFGLLSGRELGDGVQVVDGGLQGLNLLGLVERSERVVFVDSLSGFGKPGEVQVLSDSDPSVELPSDFGHSSGLGYLLRALEVGCDGTPPRWDVVGAEGTPDGGIVSAVAERALAVALRRDA